MVDEQRLTATIAGPVGCGLSWRHLRPVLIGASSPSFGSEEHQNDQHLEKSDHDPDHAEYPSGIDFYAAQVFALTDLVPSSDCGDECDGGDERVKHEKR